MPALLTPSIADVERICAVTDAVIRNLQITQCYHELALAFAQRTGRQANWCSFASWASKQAGQTIRKEDVQRTFENFLGSELASSQAAHDLAVAVQQLDVRIKGEEIVQFVWKIWNPEQAFERSSEAVARGNLKVFAEIGRGFSHFIATCLQDTAFNNDGIASFCESLLPGEPPEGQGYLRQAFLRYYQALFEKDEKARSELLLLANLEIGFHEQTRLQPEINTALEAPIIDPQELGRNLLKASFPQRGWLNEVTWLVLRLIGRLTQFDDAIVAFTEELRRQAQRAVTEYLMTIELPQHRLLRLGDDLTAMFPPALQHIENTELQSLLSQIDPTRDSTTGSGADMWGDLAERLHFIADMFRCFHFSPDLFLPPFTAEQSAALKDGKIPSGHL